MKINRSLQFQLALFIVALSYSGYMASKLPDVVPIHWNAAGQADSVGSKWLNLLLMPGVILFMAALTSILPKVSPEKFKIEPFESTYSRVMLLVSGLMLAMHVVIVETTAGAKWDISRVMMGVLYIFFIFIGNLMGKIQPNFYMGVRTPWTLADERVWKGTHRFTGKVYVFGSLIGLLLVIVGLLFWASFAYFMAISLSPIIQSYVLYVRLHKGT